MSTRDRQHSDIQRIRKRFHDEGIPRYIIWIAAIGSLGILVALVLGGERPWVIWALAAELLVLIGMLVSSRFSAIIDDRRLRSKAPPERRVVRPEVWEAVARRAGLRFRGGRTPVLSGKYGFVPLKVAFRGGEAQKTEVTVRFVGVAGLRVRVSPAAGGEVTGDLDFDGAFKVSVKPDTSAMALLNYDVRNRMIALGDIEVEFLLGKLEIRTSGFEADEERLVAIIDLAVAITRILKEVAPA